MIVEEKIRAKYLKRGINTLPLFICQPCNIYRYKGIRLTIFLNFYGKLATQIK